MTVISGRRTVRLQDVREVVDTAQRADQSTRQRARIRQAQVRLPRHHRTGGRPVGPLWQSMHLGQRDGRLRDSHVPEQLLVRIGDRLRRLFRVTIASIIRRR